MKKHLSMCARMGSLSKRGILNRAHGHGKPLLGFLLLAMFVLMPIVQAPNWSERTMDICWDGNNVYPDDDDPVWTRATTGTVARSFVYHNQIMNQTITGGGTDKYTISIGLTQYAYAEARLNIPIVVTTPSIYLRFSDTANLLYTQLLISQSYIRLAYPNIQTKQYELVYHYEDNIIGSNHTYGLLYYTDGTESYYAVYYDGNLAIWVPGQAHTIEMDEFYFLTSSAGTEYTEWDYVALDLTDSYAKIKELEDEIDDLKKDLEKLKKELEGIKPDVAVNETGLPTLPRDPRGRGSPDDNIVWLDPFKTTLYSIYASPDAGSSIALYSPYPASAEEHVCIQDDLFIGGSYTRIWGNDTVGGVEIFNTTSQLSHYSLGGCYNLTVETSGGDITVTRIVDVRLIDSFSWGENLQDGTFAVTSKTENDEIAYNWENVRIYWSWPEEDSQGRSIQIDGASIQVQDMDSSLYLDRGRHFEASEVGGIALELRYLNCSLSRTFKISFTRSSAIETVEYYQITDTDISLSDTYGNSPYTVNLHISQSGTANFEGMIVVKWLLSGKYAGQKLDIKTLIIKRSDQSGSSEFWYDATANELRLTDVSMDAGSSITYTLYWDWYTAKSATYDLLLGNPLVIYSLLLLAGFAGFLHVAMATEEEKRKKFVGFLIIGIDVIILIIVLLVS